MDAAAQGSTPGIASVISGLLASSLAILRRAGRLVSHAPSVVWNLSRRRVRFGASKESSGGPSGNARIAEASVRSPPG